jgi:hypothetical protein
LRPASTSPRPPSSRRKVWGGGGGGSWGGWTEAGAESGVEHDACCVIMWQRRAGRGVLCGLPGRSGCCKQWSVVAAAHLQWQSMARWRFSNSAVSHVGSPLRQGCGGLEWPVAGRVDAHAAVVCCGQHSQQYKWVGGYDANQVMGLATKWSALPACLIAQHNTRRCITVNMLASSRCACPGAQVPRCLHHIIAWLSSKIVGGLLAGLADCTTMYLQFHRNATPIKLHRSSHHPTS